MDNERYLFLVTREITGEITPEEQVELDALLKASVEEQEKHRLMEKFWRQEGYSEPSTDANEALMKVLARINEAQPQIVSAKTFSLSVFSKLAAAAMVVFMLGGGIYFYQMHRPTEIALIDKYSGTGSRFMITLSDGTRIWLNADTKISYPEVFAEDKREVYLTGEAFFSVASNAEKPFYIHLNKAAIRVIGTSFNVKAYSNEESIQTSVVSGKVAFMSRTTNPKAHRDSVLLIKNNKVIYSPSTGDMRTQTTNALDDREWINGKLIYKSETLEAITRQLERNFGKKVTIKDPKVGQYRFTGTFEESSLDEIMHYLSMTRSFKYEITEKTLVIY